MQYCISILKPRLNLSRIFGDIKDMTSIKQYKQLKNICTFKNTFLPVGIIKANTFIALGNWLCTSTLYTNDLGNFKAKKSMKHSV